MDCIRHAEGKELMRERRGGAKVAVVRCEDESHWKDPQYPRDERSGMWVFLLEDEEDGDHDIIADDFWEHDMGCADISVEITTLRDVMKGVKNEDNMKYFSLPEES